MTGVLSHRLSDSTSRSNVYLSLAIFAAPARCPSCHCCHGSNAPWYYQDCGLVNQEQWFASLSWVEDVVPSPSCSAAYPSSQCLVPDLTRPSCSLAAGFTPSSPASDRNSLHASCLMYSALKVTIGQRLSNWTIRHRLVVFADYWGGVAFTTFAWCLHWQNPSMHCLYMPECVRITHWSLLRCYYCFRLLLMTRIADHLALPICSQHLSLITAV